MDRQPLLGTGRALGRECGACPELPREERVSMSEALGLSWKLIFSCFSLRAGRVESGGEDPVLLWLTFDPCCFSHEVEGPQRQ